MQQLRDKKNGGDGGIVVWVLFLVRKMGEKRGREGEGCVCSSTCLPEREGARSSCCRTCIPLNTAKFKRNMRTRFLSVVSSVTHRPVAHHTQRSSRRRRASASRRRGGSRRSS